MFGQKEKPVSEQNEFEVVQKAIFTADVGIVPMNIKTYKDRLEILILYCDDKDNSEEVTVTLKFTGERLLPFEIHGRTMFWDTFDDAFRIKALPEGEPGELIPGVLIYPNEVLTMTKEFAEANYSDLALSYATFGDDTYIWYCPDGSLAPVMFETPRLFPEQIPESYDTSDEEIVNADAVATRLNPLNGGIANVSNQLFIHAYGYVRERKLSEEEFVRLYKKNMEKGK